MEESLGLRDGVAGTGEGVGWRARCCGAAVAVVGREGGREELEWDTFIASMSCSSTASLRSMCSSLSESTLGCGEEMVR